MTIIERSIAAVAIVAMLGGGGMFFSKHHAPAAVAPATIERVEKPFVCTARQYEAGECEPQTEASLPAREAKPAAPVAVPVREHKPVVKAKKHVAVPVRVQPLPKDIVLGGQYKGWTCGDVKRFVQANGEAEARRLAVANGATPDEIKLAESCTQFTWRFW